MALRGNRLRYLRTTKGLTQEQLATLLQLGKRQIHRYERELSDPASDVVARLASALGTSADYLLGLVDEPIPNLTTGHLSPDESRLIEAYRDGNLELLISIVANRHGQVSRLWQRWRQVPALALIVKRSDNYLLIHCSNLVRDALTWRAALYYNRLHKEASPIQRNKWVCILGAAAA